MVGRLVNNEFLKGFEGSGRGIIEIVSRHLPGAIEENHGKPQSG
jgi:hypothetical protein